VKPLPFASRNGYCRVVRGPGLLWDWSRLDVYVRSDDNEKETIHDD
jgi:hypothetical protein